MLLPRPSSILWLLAGWCLGVEAAVQADPNIKSIPVSLSSDNCSISLTDISLLRSYARTA